MCDYVFIKDIYKDHINIKQKNNHFGIIYNK